MVTLRQDMPFTRTKENFICGHCGAKVTGNGYTNHCPVCLWSRHVDISPGDRAHSCQGMMRPMGLEMEAGKYIILHHCQKCGAKKRNKTTPEDNFQELLKLSALKP